VRQKVTATVIALTLGAFAAIGAFASQDKVDLGAAGHLFSGGVLGAAAPGVDTPTATATVDTSGTATATETSTPEATTTGTPEATSTGTPEATSTAGHDDDASETPEASETPHADHGKHEGEECGHGHHKGTATPDAAGTPTPADTATPDTSGTATIVAEIPVHCHGEHGIEHDEGHGDGGPAHASDDHHDD